jgi:hypothetical protein
MEQCIRYRIWRRQQSMISLISIISDERVAKEFLLRGLSLQKAKYVLFLVDNRAAIY